MDIETDNLNPNPQTQANCISRLFFWWIIPFLRIGRERPLERRDVPDVLHDDSSVRLVNELRREWEKELYSWKTHGNASLHSALSRCYLKRACGISSIYFLKECFRLVLGVFLWYIVNFLEIRTGRPDPWIYLLTGGGVLCFLFVSALENLASHLSQHLGLRVHAACVGLVYRKTLYLSQQGLQQTTPGNVINLAATEAEYFERGCRAFAYVWVTPAQGVLGGCLLWTFLNLHAYTLVGLAQLIILSLLHVYLNTVIMKIRNSAAVMTERRLRVVSEVVQGINMVKYNCWEASFHQLLERIRNNEVRHMRKLSYVRGFMSSIQNASGKFAYLAVFLSIMHRGLPMASILSVMATYHILSDLFGSYFPWSIQHMKNMRRAVYQIQDFLLLEEKNMLDTRGRRSLDMASSLPDNVAIKMEKYVSSWTQHGNPVAVNDISLSIQKGEFVAICGCPGSGKSAFLLSLLGELPKMGGTLAVKGSLAYVPPTPWLYNTTIRENITLGAKYERKFYYQVLHACNLLQDIASLLRGDQTFYGEHGVTLGTSLKVKIALARAVYQNADIYLLDTPFYNINNKETKHIYMNCLCKMLNRKTVAMVTDKPEFMKAADKVIMLHQNRIAGIGTYTELESTCPKFQKWLSHCLPVETTSIYYRELRLRPRSEVNYELEDRCMNCEEVVLMEMKEQCNSGIQAFQNSSDDGQQRGVGIVRTWQYLRYGAGVPLVGFLVFIYLSVQALYILSDWFLFSWFHNSSAPVYKHLNGTITSETLRARFQIVPFFTYLGTFILFLLFTVFCWLGLGYATSSSSKKLHQMLFMKILHAELPQFKCIGLEKILTGFSRDVSVIDCAMPATFRDTAQLTGAVLGSLVLACAANYWLFIVLFLAVVVFVLMKSYCFHTSISLKHLKTSASSQLYLCMAQTLQGLSTLRAFKQEERFLNKFSAILDHHTSISYLQLSSRRWLAIHLDLVTGLFVTSTLFGAILLPYDSKYVQTSLVSLSIMYCLTHTGLLQHAAGEAADVQHQLNSVNHISELCKISQETSKQNTTKPPLLWPQYGIVTLEGVTVMDQHGTKLLRNLYVCIRAREKVGILGSSEQNTKTFLTALLRLEEPFGIIRMDALDICDLNLHDLREAISVIPAEPFLFSGSVKRNLDPYASYPDSSVWKALEDVELRDKIEQLPEQLYTDLAPYLHSFTLGDRLLLCIARTLLKGSRIIIIEESKGHVDHRSWATFHHILRTRFERSTVITLAHSLDAVVEMDRVLILEGGKVKEYDTAHALLGRRASLLYKMAQSLDVVELSVLQQRAREKFENQPYKSLRRGESQRCDNMEVRIPHNFIPSFCANHVTPLSNHLAGNWVAANRY